MDTFLRSLLDKIIFHRHYVVVGIGALIPILLDVHNRLNLSHIPTIRSTGLLSYWDRYRYLFRAKEVLLEGYHKFRDSPGFFKVATPRRWQVMIASPEMINELRMAKNDDMSLDHAFEEEFASRYTVGLDATASTYHLDAVRITLTNNLGFKLEEIHDEMTQAFEDLMPVKGGEWLAVPALSTFQKIICRASNRMFVGEPMCRNPEWLDLNIKFTLGVILKAVAINLFPYFLQPVVGSILSPIHNALHLCRGLLGDEVAQRLEVAAEYGVKYEDRPRDLISWLIERAPCQELTVDSILTRVFIVNMGAIHASSDTFMLALLNIATHPEYTAPMREEVISIVKEYGWSKQALNNMHKVDSFFKESVRLNGTNGMTRRKVINRSGYTFANGLHLPYGTWVNIPTYAIHHDPQYYDNPSTFDGFRFSKMREIDGEGLKHQMVSTNLHYLAFGHGRHACPGRFFISNVLKMLLAHLLVTYEIKLETLPKEFWFGPNLISDGKVRILFRRLEASPYLNT